MVTEFTEAIDSQGGLIIPEPKAEGWQAQYFRNKHLLNWKNRINDIGSRLKSGSWNGSDLTNIVVEFAEDGKIGVTTVTFPDKAVAITSTHQIWYADKATETIVAATLAEYAAMTFSDDHFPLLYTGHYRDTGTTTAAFSRFIAIRKDPRIEFVEAPDMLVFTESELNVAYANDPRYVKYDQANKIFKKKDGTTRTPTIGEWTQLNSLETLTAALEFPYTYDRGKITVGKGVEIPVGDQGAGEPYPIFCRGDNCLVDIWIDTTLDTLVKNLWSGILPTATELSNSQVFKNRGEGNRVILNGEQIYSGGRPTFVPWPRLIKHPYVFFHNGYAYHGIAKSGVNDDETLMIDAWKALGGDEDLGLAPIHNPYASYGFYYKLWTPDTAGHYRRIGTPPGGTTGVDSSAHDRPSFTGSATITSGNYTSDGTNIIKGIPDSLIVMAKWLARARCGGGEIPDYNSTIKATTIIGDIKHNATDDNWLYLIDSETGADVDVLATGSFYIDGGGNSGYSFQDYATGPHTHQITGYNVQAIINNNGDGLTNPVYRAGATFNPTGYTAVSGYSTDGVNSGNNALEARVKSINEFFHTFL